MTQAQRLAEHLARAAEEGGYLDALAEAVDLRRAFCGMARPLGGCGPKGGSPWASHEKGLGQQALTPTVEDGAFTTLSQGGQAALSFFETAPPQKKQSGRSTKGRQSKSTLRKPSTTGRST